MVGLGPKLTLSTCAAQQIQITSTSRFWSTKILLSIGPFDVFFFLKKNEAGTIKVLQGFDEGSYPPSTRFAKFAANLAAWNKQFAIRDDIVIVK